MMKKMAKENGLMRAAMLVRRGLLAAASNESLFFAAAFLTVGILPTDLLLWHQEAVDMMLRYVIVPWGMALSLIRLERRSKLTDAPQRADLSVLFMLLLWVIVPFGIRFGLTFNNVSNWHGHIAVYFGIYAMLTEEEPQRRERLFDQACALMGLISLMLGGALLYCAAEGITIDSDFVVYRGNYTGGGFGFGVYNNSQLCSGFHYNITGMISVCCAAFCLAGLCRSRHIAAKALYFLAFAMMVIVIVLTQSRTARYALILALAASLYGYLAANLRISRAVIRRAAGLAAAAAVTVLSFIGASMLTDAALAHYANVQQADMADVSADADQGMQAEAQNAVKPKEARTVGDASFTGRTIIWGGLFNFWRENPKNLVIGNGIGRTGSRILKGTAIESLGAIAVHNTYLQHIADFGLIGFGVLCVFFAVILCPILRVFFARGENQRPGYRAMCMLVLACLLTGMMESAPLGAMTPMNMALFFALALLAARGKEIGRDN